MIYIFFAFFNCLLDRVHTKTDRLRFFADDLFYAVQITRESDSSS